MKLHNKFQKLYAILIIKSNNAEDFVMWLDWYEKFIKCDKIVIINDNSDIAIVNYINNYDNIILIDNLFSKDNQIENYNSVIQEILKPNIDDIIIMPDFDEFWWYDTTKFNSFIECAMNEFIKFKTNSVCVPWTNMMCKDLLEERPWYIMNYNDLCKYRVNISITEIKPIILYNGKPFENVHHGLKDFKTITNINLDENKKGIIFAETDYTYYLRLYHYRITTILEYNNKIKTSLIKKNIRNNKRIYMNKDIHKYLTETNQYPHTLDLTVDDVLKTINTL